MATTTISLTDEAYNALRALKKQGQSFSDVIVENLPPQPRTCGELLDALEKDFTGVQLLDESRIEQVLQGRGRRSPRRSFKR